jgi:muramoyltetrapeptide carboxypeptidase
MKVLKPKKLNKGDTIGLISPASSPKDLTRIEKATKYFESLGYRVKIGKNVGKTRAYLAGNDKERLKDLMDMFIDKIIKAVFCIRGGYGSNRLLDKIDYDIIKKNPKIFVGYSDITALQNAFLKKCGLITFAGPMPAVDFWDAINPYAEENFWKSLTWTKPLGKLPNYFEHSIEFLSKGEAIGRLIGGNLAVFVSLLATPFLPEIKNNILILEDIDEPPYKIDRMLNQLKLAGFFNKLSAIALGIFVDCVEKEGTATLSLEEVFNDYIAKLKIPILKNLSHGHITTNLTLPIGAKTKISSKTKTIEIIENVVEE